MALSSNISLSINSNEELDFDLNTSSGPIKINCNTLYSEGSGNLKFNKCWLSKRTLTAGTNETLCLNDGSLLDDFNVPLIFTGINAIFIKNIGPGEYLQQDITCANPWAYCWPSVFIWKDDTVFKFVENSSKWPVDATHNQIRFVNTSGASSLTYYIYIQGS